MGLLNENKRLPQMLEQIRNFKLVIDSLRGALVYSAFARGLNFLHSR